MADVHDAATRRKNMRAIRHRDTAIEKKVSQLLITLDIPFQQQAGGLPGRPDFLLPEQGKIIFTHGCFWHCHHCRLYKLPATRREFWQDKIGRNVARDRQNLALLRAQGWKVLVIWECAMKGRTRLSDQQLSERIEEWVCAADTCAQISDQGMTLLL